MKLIYDSQKDHRYIERLTHHFLESRKGELMTGRKAAIMFQDIYGMIIDWHEFSATLDAMEQRDECFIHGQTNDGMMEYFIR